MLKQRLMIFVDGSNLMKAVQQYINGLKIDYIKFKEILTSNRELQRIYFFDAIPNNNDKKNFDKKTKFLDFLRYNGYTVKTKPLKYKNLVNFENPFQKGVDVLLVCELFKMAKENAFDVAIIVSGDNDFASAIELVQDMGKNVEIAAFQKSMGHDLKQGCNKLITLDKYAPQFAQDVKNQPKSI